MKLADTKLKKTVIIVISSIIITMAVVILLISPITKYLIEKYDVKYTGRQIKMDWVYVNPFTGYVHFSNLKVYEYKSDSIFISINSLSANFAMLKLFSKTIKLTDLTFDKLRVTIIQTKRIFNFDDIVTTFSFKGPPDTTQKPFHFYFQNIKINDGHFFYRDQVIPVSYSIKNVYIESKDGWSWDNDVISAKVSFLSGIGYGGMKGSYFMNLKTLNYNLDVIVDKFDLKVLEQYLKGYANYGTFRANMDANLKTNGCFRDAQNINIKGLLAVNGFHFGKNKVDDYLSFDKIVFDMNDVNPMKNRYFIDSMSLIHPYFKYERYDSLDNLQNMFGRNGTNLVTGKLNDAKFNLVFEIANYIKMLSKNFFRSDFKVNRLAIYKGDVKFNDFSINDKFSIAANPLYIIADSIAKNHKRVNIAFKSRIQPYGAVTVNVSINPKDSSDFDLHYHLQKLAASMFNPYLITYTSFPLDRGTIELNGNWTVRNGIIKSDNHLLIIDPRVSMRLKNKNTKRIPVRLLMFFIRERGNVIDYEIPISGNLKNPKFHLHDIMKHAFTNVFVKPVTIPYRSNVKYRENEIEKSLTLKWNMRQSSLIRNQKKFVNKMVEFLKQNPEASISVYPMQYAEKEKEYIRFFEAKKKYFLFINNKNAGLFSEKDSLIVDKMSVKDSKFVYYLDKKVHNPMLFTVQDKCNLFIGSGNINAKFNRLNKERKNAFMSDFKKDALANRVIFHNGENSIPYNGYSFYKIVYKGEFPKYLTRAYQIMNDLNNETPRKEFKKEREKNKGVL